MRSPILTCKAVRATAACAVASLKAAVTRLAAQVRADRSQLVASGATGIV